MILLSLAGRQKSLPRLPTQPALRLYGKQTPPTKFRNSVLLQGDTPLCLLAKIISPYDSYHAPENAFSVGGRVPIFPLAKIYATAFSAAVLICSKSLIFEYPPKVLNRWL